MFLGSNQPRSKRSFEGRAPIPSNDSYEPAERTQTIFKHSQPAEWKPEPYTRMLFDACFKNWKERVWMKTKNIYDATGDKVEELHFRKQSSDYGIRFNDLTYNADVTLTIDALPHYLKQFNLKTEEEVNHVYPAGRQI